MSSKDSEAERRINDAIEDGGGCTEAWEALSSVREDESEQGRRSFIARLGMTIGAVPIGAATVGEVAAKSRKNKVKNEDISIERLRGRERGQLLRRANTSEQVRFAADQLGKRGGVSHVYKYNTNGDTGYGVTYGAEDESSSPTIRYYESDGISDSGTKVIGGVTESDGILGTDAEAGIVFDVGETTNGVETAGYLQNNDDYNEYRRGLAADEAVREDEIVVVRTVTDVERPSGIYIPVEKDGEVVNRVVLTGPGTPSADTINDFSMIQPTPEGQFTTQDNDAVVCGPFGICANYCTLLCSSVAGLTGAGCTAGCAAFIVDAPISPACGAICAGVTAGVCYPTCVNKVN